MPPSEHLAAFARGLKGTRRLLSRQKKFFEEGVLPKSELEAIYELCFIRIYILFERELTELLKTNMMMEVGSDGLKRSLFVTKNRADALRLLIGSDSFFQILPIETLERTAKVYLKDGKPFTGLSQARKQELRKAAAIRNYIAHRSAESKDKFQRKVLSQISLPRNSSVPGFYLGCFQTATVTYFDHHVSELGGCLSDLCNAS